MDKKLNDIKDLLVIPESLNNFELSFRNSKEWDLCLSKTNYQPYLYTNFNIDFAFEIIYSKHKIAKDLSLIVKNQNKCIAILPMFVFHNHESYIIGFSDHKILPPLFVEGVSKKIKKQTIEIIINFLDAIKEKLNVKSLEFIDNKLPSSSISEWHKTIVNKKYESNVVREAFVNLNYDLSQIKSLIRKSYKSLISKGEKLWDVQTSFSVSKKTWNEFKKLHLKAAGRQTRSDKSWEILEQGLKNKELFFIYCLNNEKKMVGGSLFFLSRNEAYYGIAAYDRELFENPIGHVIQYRAIHEFKKMNLSWYRLGRVPYASDYSKPSEKEINIGRFKNGFSTDIFPEFIMVKSKK